MSLVNYESSSEDENEEENLPEKPEGASGQNDGNLNLSNLLPKPKETNTATPIIETTTSKGSIKISVPKLPDSDSDDEYSSNVPKASPSPSNGSENDPSKPRLGLFAKLPAPSNSIGRGKQANRTFVPHVFSKKKQRRPAKTEKKINSNTNSANSSSTAGLSIKEIREKSTLAAAKFLSKSAVLTPEDNIDSDEEDSVDFFSYVEKTSQSDPLPKPSLKVSPSKDVTNPHHDVVTMNPATAVNSSTDIIPENANQFAATDDKSIVDGIMKLQGKRRREEINFIDIRADDALAGNKELLLKSISEEKMINRESHSKKKNVGAPSSLQKRKHQLTYLVHEAKKRELELKNTWAQNRASKMQTQAKYGF